MKHIRTNILLLTLCMICTPLLHAENIDEADAREAAAYYFRQNTSDPRVTASNLTLSRQWDNEELGIPAMYLFTTPSHGWILFGASTIIDPVVAYSEENTMDDPFNLPDNLEWWLGEYHELFCYAQAADAANRIPASQMWQTLSSKSMKASTKDTKVTLLTTSWDQGDQKAHDYNLLSPYDGSKRCPVGCVATALSQICKYYEYPKKGTNRATNKWNDTTFIYYFPDSTIFDYSVMPNKVYTSTPLDACYQVSRLAFAIGTAVKMSYSADGSGAMSQAVPEAMRKYFKYGDGANTIKIVYRDNTADTSYMRQVRKELEAKHPLYMSGSSSTGSGADAAGHAWVCDGYRTDDDTKYHMNWGWGGSGNAFYNLYNNDMPISMMGYNFNRHQAFIANLVPPADTLAALFVSIQTVEQQNTVGAAYPNPATTQVSIPYHSIQNGELTVYSVDGRQVESQRVSAGDGKVTLDVNKMPAGIYIYRLGNSYGKFVVK